MSEKTDNALSFGIGILAGVLGGIVAGFLLSPKTGEEMRRELKIKADKLIKETPSKAVEAKKTNIASIEKLQYAIEARFNQVIDAIKAGRMAAAKRKEEMEAGFN